MIAVPQAAEQFLNADQLVELGVARRIDTPDATAEALRTALRELVADPEVARRSARLRADARAEGGTTLGRRPHRVHADLDPRPERGWWGQHLTTPGCEDQGISIIETLSGFGCGGRPTR